MFKIGDFSKICRVPVSALRYYADIGLLEPASIDKFTGYRYYALDQLPRLNRILALKDLGLSLEQIQQVMNESLDAAEIRGMLRLKEAELHDELMEQEARLARVRARLNLIEQEQIPMPQQEVVLKTIETQTIISRREVIAEPQGIARLLTEVCMMLATNQIDFAGQPFTIFHDDEFKQADMDVEIAVPVMNVPDAVPTLEGERELRAYPLPALQSAACIIHVGDYDTLLKTYEVVGRWIEQSGYSFNGAIREIYLRPPGEDEPAMTEIQFPVEKAS